MNPYFSSRIFKCFIITSAYLVMTTDGTSLIYSTTVHSKRSRNASCLGHLHEGDHYHLLRHRALTRGVLQPHSPTRDLSSVPRNQYRFADPIRVFPWVPDFALSMQVHDTSLVCNTTTTESDQIQRQLMLVCTSLWWVWRGDNTWQLHGKLDQIQLKFDGNSSPTRYRCSILQEPVHCYFNIGTQASGLLVIVSWVKNAYEPLPPSPSVTVHPTTMWPPQEPNAKCLVLPH